MTRFFFDYATQGNPCAIIAVMSSATSRPQWNMRQWSPKI